MSITLSLCRFLKKLYKFSTKKANSQLESSFKLVLESCLNSCYCSPLFAIVLKDFFIVFHISNDDWKSS